MKKYLVLAVIALSLASCTADSIDSNSKDCGCDRVTNYQQFNTTTGTYWKVTLKNDCDLYPVSYRNVYSKPKVGDCL